MAAPPVFYRSSGSQQYTGSFPPPLYYRDTYGLQQLHDPLKRKFTDSMTTDASDDTVTTQSTVRTTVNIHHPTSSHPGMFESSTSKGTGMTQSFHVEQMITSEVIILQARALFTLAIVAFAASLQLLIFALICLFYDGCPLYMAIIASIIFMANATLLAFFIHIKPTRALLKLCIIANCICLVLSIALFLWTAYLVYGEDKKIRYDGWNFSKDNLLKTNRIVANTRMAMYSLHMIIAPVHAICCIAIVYILVRNLNSLQDQQIMRGYFFTEPQMGHQTVLVPIELKQVKSLDDLSVENASIAVQTSGTSPPQLDDDA